MKEQAAFEPESATWHAFTNSYISYPKGGIEIFLNMSIEAAYSDSNAEANTISGNSRHTSLGSQSGRFYANTIRACMTQ